MHVSFVFLEFNGVSIRATPEDACVTFLGLAAGEISEPELALWFARNTEAR
jgi:prophage maintenance system killer protein